MTLKIQQTCLKLLQKCRKIIKAKVLPVKTTRARAHAHVAKSAVSENNTCTCTCRTCNLISAEKATIRREKMSCYVIKAMDNVQCASIQFGMHLDSQVSSQRCSQLHLEHLLRYLRALPTFPCIPSWMDARQTFVHSLTRKLFGDSCITETLSQRLVESFRQKVIFF